MTLPHPRHQGRAHQRSTWWMKSMMRCATLAPKLFTAFCNSRWTKCRSVEEYEAEEHPRPAAERNLQKTQEGGEERDVLIRNSWTMEQEEAQICGVNFLSFVETQARRISQEFSISLLTWKHTCASYLLEVRKGSIGSSRSFIKKFGCAAVTRSFYRKCSCVIDRQSTFTSRI